MPKGTRNPNPDYFKVSPKQGQGTITRKMAKALLASEHAVLKRAPPRPPAKPARPRGGRGK